MLQVIGIGASAGGLEALNQFFKNCPPNMNVAFVIIQHLSPDHKSMMPELLSRNTDMPVSIAASNTSLKPNHIYLIPSNKNIVLKNNRLELQDRARTHLPNLPIDLFFGSLATELKEKAVAVILSGTGSDGTKGAQKIKEAGGSIFVQDPDSAKFDGMPLSVIENGYSDYVLEAKDLAVEINSFVKHPFSMTNLSLDRLEKEEYAIQQILGILRNKLQLDFFLYRRQTLVRRIIKRMKINRLDTLSTYIDFLKGNLLEQRRLSNEFLIGVTNFFRDPELFEVFKQQVLTAVVQNAKEKNIEIKAWVPGCSTGQEAYSIAIALEQFLEQEQIRLPYKIFATDINALAIETASRGLYDKATIDLLDPEIQKKYFIQQNGHYRVHPKIRKNIIFSTHDILKNPPFNGMDFVSCRNLLIYLNNQAQQKALESIHFATKLDGYLFLGSSESIGSLQDFYVPIDRKAKIFKNIAKSRPITNTVLQWGVSSLPRGRHRKTRSRQALKELQYPDISEVLLDFTGSVCILVDEKADILQAYGKLRRFVNIPEEGFSSNLLNLLPAELSIAVRSSIRVLSEDLDGAKQVLKIVDGIIKGEMVRTNLRVDRFTDLENQPGICYLVSMFEVQRKKMEPETASPSNTELIGYVQKNQELKLALDNTHKNLQSTIEELETYNEEIQSTNEELIASNEELQSTNEELQTVNEELHTVNSELLEKNLELQEAYADMDNYFNSLRIGTIFLDKNFKLRRFTPQIEELVHLDDSDIGRSIISFSWPDREMFDEVKKVLETKQTIRKEIQTTQGIWYLQQISPYQTHDKEIDGIVINFFNINSLKRALDDKAYYFNMLEKISNLSPSIITVRGTQDQQLYYSSGSIHKILGYKEEEFYRLSEEDRLFDWILEEDQAKLRKNQKAIEQLGDEEILKINYRIRTKDKGIRWLTTFTKVFERNESGKVAKVISLSFDNTEQQAKQQEIERLNVFLENIHELMPGILYVQDIRSTQNIYYGGAMKEVLGYSIEEAKEKRIQLDAELLETRSFERYQAHLKKLQQRKDDKTASIELQAKRKDGQWIWVEAFEKVFERDEKGLPTKAIGMALDIDELKQSKWQLEKTIEQLQQTNQDLERFNYIASHDLKEPLNSIISVIDLLRMEFSEEQEHLFKLFNIFEDSADRMKKLIDDLLSHALLGQEEFILEEIDLKEMIDVTQENLTVQIQKTNAQIIYADLPAITGDPTQIQLLFQNLISNGIKYNKNRPEIEIGFQEEEQNWRFYVKDNGIGIAKKNHESLFELFKKLHPKGEYPGSGIGLANCKRIVQNHGGMIWVESALNKGATFYFTIKK